ncbi:WD40/YVTN/BNR-like repeat-containing protein [Endozoicomonadaceae bacterium StTr2]
MKPEVWLPAFARRVSALGEATRSVKRYKAAAVSLLISTSLSSFPVAQASTVEAKLTGAKPSSELAMPTELASRSLLLDIDRLPDSERLVAVGERGHIVFSDDHGTTWKQATVPTRQMLTAAVFPTAEVGYAVGHDAVILKTEDGGKSWNKVYSDLELEKPLMDVWFRDADYGIAVGAYGLILRTRDGGKSWEDLYDAVENEDEFHYNAIAPLGEGLMIVGEAGTLYRSLDEGESWETLYGEYDGSYFGLISLPGKNQALAHGLRGNVYRTRDGGDNWQQVELDTDQTLFGAIAVEGDVMMVGYSGVVVKGQGVSSATPKYKSHTRADRMTLSKVTLAANGSLVAVGQGGVHILSPASSTTGVQ